MQILIVEDNDINAAVLTHFLIPYGHPVHRVVNGKQAVDYVQNHPVGLIMMDINMPIMDGHEATKQIRAETSIEQPPIIAVTADVTMASERKCTEVGMNGFLSKPLNAKKLATEVEQYLVNK